MLNKPSPSDTTSFRIRKTLLERPHLMILDEGHIVRNKQAQVLKQMYAVRTPLRVLLSGSTQFLLVPYLGKEVLCREVVPTNSYSFLGILVFLGVLFSDSELLG